MHERIKLLRETVGLSQAAFGQRIGVSRDVINNLERGRVEIKDHIVKLICAEYKTSETWLRDGTGPMYTEEPMFSLDRFVRDHGGTDLEIEIMKAYFELDPEIRKKVWDHFKARFPAIGSPGLDDVPGTPEELEGQFPPVENSGSQVS